MRLLTVLLLLVLSVDAQDRHDWRAVGQLHPGDRVRLSLKTGPVDGEFQAWTVDNLTVGTITAKKEDVLRIERYRAGEKHGMGRGKKAAIGALIGFGGGFAVGALIQGNCNSKSPAVFGNGCLVPRAELGAGFAGAGAVVGAAIGAFLPSRHGGGKEMIYSAR